MTRAGTLLPMIEIVRHEGPKIHSNGGPSNPNIDLPSPSGALFDIESFETDAVNAAWFLVQMSRQEVPWKDQTGLGTVEPESCVRDARVSDADLPFATSKIPTNDEVLAHQAVTTDAARKEDELAVRHDQENRSAAPKSTYTKRSSRARGQSFKGKLRTYRTKRVKAKKNQRDSTVQETESCGTPGPDLVDAEDNYDALDMPVKSRNFKSLSALLGTK